MMRSSTQRQRKLQWPQALTITIVLSGAVFVGVPEILIAPVWHSWPRAFLALGMGLMPIVWSVYLLVHCTMRADRLVTAVAVVLGLFWLAMSGNLIWVMVRAFYERS